MFPQIEKPNITKATDRITTFTGFLMITFAIDLNIDWRIFLWEKLLGLKSLCLMQGIDPFLFSSIRL